MNIKMSLFYSRILWLLITVTVGLAAFLASSRKAMLIELALYSFNRTQFVFPIILDSVRLILMSTVFFISANVLHLSNLYMEDEVYLRRFTHLVLLLIGSIRALIFIPHITALLLGWDGLGLVSFLLVTFYASPKALGAGVLTALRNRIGDALILIRISLMYEWSYHLDLVRFFGQPLGRFCLIVAAITKRAQFPLSRWLPAAIEAPTPVSALVHSSTLVTAGVYLIIRFYPFLSRTAFFNHSILAIGAITRLLAGIRAITELDLKKVIALSTLSQLGLIIIRVGLGYPKLAFLHLLTHAMFKALLFICAGCIIHFHGHAQDIRQIGGISHQLPVTRSAICVSNLALCAVPFIAGFYSKDVILETLFFRPLSLVITIVALASTVFTGMYSTRLILMGVVSHQKSPARSRFSEPIILPILSLSLGALFGGALIGSVVGPFAFEPLRPAIKRGLIFILFFGPSVVILSGKTSSINVLAKLKWGYYASGRRIFWLTPTTSQNFLELFRGPSRKMARFDQSWLEAGQTQAPSIKGSRFINLLLASGIMAVVFFTAAF